LKPRAATHTGEGLAIAAGTPEPLMQATVSEGAKKQAIVAFGSCSSVRFGISMKSKGRVEYCPEAVLETSP